MRDKMVKLRGPNGTTKEITLDEWNSYTPLNRHAQRVAALSHTLMELGEVLVECHVCGQEERLSKEAAKKEDVDCWYCEQCAAADDHCLGDPN
jgi:hypothetical protein